MDAEHMDFPDDAFDIVCGSGVLHHLDLPVAYAEIARVLRPSGLAAFWEPLGYNPALRLWRRLTPGCRTSDEHPLRFADMALARTYFAGVRPSYWCLTTLLAIPFQRTPVFSRLVGSLALLDALLFRLPPLRPLAWMAILVLRAPRSRPVTPSGSMPGRAR
jgi:SAM-dependent methyltransferase